MVDSNRVRERNEKEYRDGSVVYWMQRDQRTQDNFALLYAQEKALEYKVPLLVVFNYMNAYSGASQPHYLFMLQGLQVVEKNLRAKNIPLIVTGGKPEETITALIEKEKAGLLVTDFNPLRLPESWKNRVAKKIKIPFHEVDAHNIIPCWVASDKEEFAAHTFRPKVRLHYRTFAVLPKQLKAHPYGVLKKYTEVEWKNFTDGLSVDKNAESYAWIKPGEDASKKALKRFIEDKLKGYDTKRNDPTQDAQSDLSPYLHFGHIASVRVAIEVEKAKAGTDDTRAFLEELVVRKELSDNFCFYQKNYDSFDGLKDWAKKTLCDHTKDKREFLYTKKEFERGQTHDPLWNSAQLEMVKKGKMHGYMRMYWAKKILEWTKTPEEAIAIAVSLNDTYSLDGRDPNGYVGVLWSIGGIHDRAWFERPIFGKIRYMNDNGCKRKFDVPKYIEYVAHL